MLAGAGRDTLYSHQPQSPEVTGCLLFPLSKAENMWQSFNLGDTHTGQDLDMPRRAPGPRRPHSAGSVRSSFTLVRAEGSKEQSSQSMDNASMTF
jgi:hypothetical protein